MTRLRYLTAGESHGAQLTAGEEHRYQFVTAILINQEKGNKRGDQPNHYQSEKPIKKAGHRHVDQ
jgi:chorismate synthase